MGGGELTLITWAVPLSQHSRRDLDCLLWDINVYKKNKKIKKFTTSCLAKQFPKTFSSCCSDNGIWNIRKTRLTKMPGLYISLNVICGQNHTVNVSKPE